MNLRPLLAHLTTSRRVPKLVLANRFGEAGIDAALEKRLIALDFFGQADITPAGTVYLNALPLEPRTPLKPVHLAVQPTPAPPAALEEEITVKQTKLEQRCDDILALLADQAMQTQQIAALLKIPNGSLSGALSVLVRDGLVTRSGKGIGGEPYTYTLPGARVEPPVPTQPIRAEVAPVLASNQIADLERRLLNAERDVRSREEKIENLQNGLIKIMGDRDALYAANANLSQQLEVLPTPTEATSSGPVSSIPDFTLEVDALMQILDACNPLEKPAVRRVLLHTWAALYGDDDGSRLL